MEAYCKVLTRLLYKFIAEFKTGVLKLKLAGAILVTDNL